MENEGSETDGRAMTSSRPLVLCVDDEPEILHGLRLHLVKHYEVLSATSGESALGLLRDRPDVSVIVSDMRMPNMNGAEFLSRTIAIAPHAFRILLTGDTDLSSAVAAINEGQIYRFVSKPCPPHVLLGIVAEAVERFGARELERTATRRRVEQRQLQLDPQTDLGSRQWIMAELEAAAFSAEDRSCALAAFFIDIDSTDEPAAVGDLPWGDELAGIIADRLRLFWPDAARLARWGMDQFVALFASDAVSDSELQALGEKLHAALTESVVVNGSVVKVRANIGIARLEDRLHWQGLVRHAAAAARDARASDRICMHAKDSRLPIGVQSQLLHALRGSVDRCGLTLHYQPIVDVVGERTIAMEALVRWNHPSVGNVEPAVFIPMLEQSGDIVELGRWVLLNACREAAPLVREQNLRLAVNVSPLQVLHEGFVEHLESCLVSSGIPTDALELEVTETAMATNMERFCEMLNRVRAIGVRLAVDDFGTGYSSLSYLNRLPIDTLKVDRVFVQDFYRGGRTIIKAALAVAQDFGKEVIVEGVESSAMLQEIARTGVTLVQGFCYARPMPMEQFCSWLKSNPVPRSRVNEAG
jgi:diguanylate cyclase